MSESATSFYGICREEFTDEEMLRKHLRSHITGDPFPLELGMNGLGASYSGPSVCDLCGEEFIDMGMLRKHLRAQETLFLLTWPANITNLVTLERSPINARHVTKDFPRVVI